MSPETDKILAQIIDAIDPLNATAIEDGVRLIHELQSDDPELHISVMNIVMNPELRTEYEVFLALKRLQQGDVDTGFLSKPATPLRPEEPKTSWWKTAFVAIAITVMTLGSVVMFS